MNLAFYDQRIDDIAAVVNRDETPNRDVTCPFVNIDHRDMLRDLLISIGESTNRITYEIIVVDNVSKDDSVEMLQHDFPDVRVIELQERIGYGPAHNHSLEFFNGRNFLVFNEDMKVLPGALDTMVETLDREETLGVLGCRRHGEQHHRDEYPERCAWSHLQTSRAFSSCQGSASRVPGLAFYAVCMHVPARNRSIRVVAETTRGHE